MSNYHILLISLTILRFLMFIASSRYKETNDDSGRVGDW